MKTSSPETLRSSNVTEHRWGQRIALQLAVRLDVGGENVGRGMLRNASISGAFVESGVKLPVFTNLVIRLPGIDNGDPGAYELPACVVRCEAAGFALEWRDMACPPIVELLERS